MKIGVICAMDSEFRQLAGRMAERTESSDGLFTYTHGRIGRNEVVLMQCGIGKVNAAAGTLRLTDRHRPHCVLSTGVAGGIDPCLGVADMVAGSRTVYHDVWCGEGNAYGQVQGLPAQYEADRRLLELALSLDGPEHRVHGGLICTGDRFITDRAGLDAIKGKFPEGLAVDMESAAIAQVCHLCRVPFLSLRVISDTPGADNHAAQYAGFWETLAGRSFDTTWRFLELI